MKTARLQAAFARKREVENLRIERTQETNRYFDHWGKVTSRFQTWTTPEYYENAEIKLKEHKQKVKKDEKLNERREKLQKLLDIENQQYENELQSIILRKQSPSVLLGSGRRSKYDSIDTNIFEKIKENRSDEMRRLELEAKLYKKWRNPTSGVTLSTTPLAIVANNDDNNNNSNEYLKNNSLFESKSDNEIMAKLNWLDKQIENQMRREEDEKEFQQRTLKLQEEATKREEIQRERQLIRESEIKELRTIQENHVAALKEREQETIQLQQDEQHYRHILETIQIELNSLKINYEKFLKIFEDSNLPHNIKKIKILFRQLSDEFNERYQNDIDCLKRIQLLYSYASSNNNNNNNSSDSIRLITILNMIENFQKQFNTENLNQSDICNMYESEAKNNFKKWHELWYNQEILRKKKLIELLEHDHYYYNTKLNDNIKKQKLIIEIRETHLSAMENSNEKLKMLINTNNNNNFDNNTNININNNIKISKYDNNNNNNNDNNDNDCNEYIKNKNKNNSTTMKGIISWNNNEPLKIIKKKSLIRKSDGEACLTATTNNIVSRASSRISNINDLNSYREESANSFQNTKSRIFGWLDDDIIDNKKTIENLSQSNNNTKSLHKNEYISNETKIKTAGITTTTKTNNNNNNNNKNTIIPINKTIREDLISDLRKRNSYSKIINDNNIIDDDNNYSFNKISIKNNDIDDIHQSNDNINDTISKKKLNKNNCSIIDNKEKSLQNSFGPKFGRKKFAWT